MRSSHFGRVCRIKSSHLSEFAGWGVAMWAICRMRSSHWGEFAGWVAMWVIRGSRQTNTQPHHHHHHLEGAMVVYCCSIILLHHVHLLQKGRWSRRWTWLVGPAAEIGGGRAPSSFGPSQTCDSRISQKKTKKTHKKQKKGKRISRIIRERTQTLYVY